mmetsp:Transcript_42704/g.63345  ORF Transcript_42704/g.63345 Transcript_42704/m.63345 type:complete len:102 (-) Transcript_42704:199-504(-)
MGCSLPQPATREGMLLPSSLHAQQADAGTYTIRVLSYDNTTNGKSPRIVTTVLASYDYPTMGALRRWLFCWTITTEDMNSPLLCPMYLHDNDSFCAMNRRS